MIRPPDSRLDLSLCWASLFFPHSSLLSSADVGFLPFPQELNKYRAKCSMLFHYDWISIPLVYTQVTASPPQPQYLLHVQCCV